MKGWGAVLLGTLLSGIIVAAAATVAVAGLVSTLVVLSAMILGALFGSLRAFLGALPRAFITPKPTDVPLADNQDADLSLLVQIGTAALESQWQQAAVLDAKLSANTALGSVFAVFVPTLLAKNDIEPPAIELGLGIAAMACLFLAVLLGLIGLRLYEFKGFTPVADIIRMKAPEAMRSVASDLDEAWRHNEVHLRRKAATFTSGLGFLVLGLMVTASGVVFGLVE